MIKSLCAGASAQSEDTAHSILPAVIENKNGMCYVQPHTEYASRSHWIGCLSESTARRVSWCNHHFHPEGRFSSRHVAVTTGKQSSMAPSTHKFRLQPAAIRVSDTGLPPRMIRPATVRDPPLRSACRVLFVEAANIPRHCSLGVVRRQESMRSQLPALLAQVHAMAAFFETEERPKSALD